MAAYEGTFLANLGRVLHYAFKPWTLPWEGRLDRDPAVDVFASGLFERPWRDALAQVGPPRDGAPDRRYLGIVSSSPAVFADVVPPEWRDHYAALAAAWMRQHGTIPPSLETLARWDAGVALEDELAFLEGRGPDPCSKSG